MQVLKTMKRPSIWSLALTSAACLLGAAQASADPAVVRSVTVNYRDLNLATIEGATTLYTRLRGAARKVCEQPDTGLDDHRAWQACYRAAIADAVAKVNSPLLTALNAGPNTHATTTAMLVK